PAQRCDLKGAPPTDQMAASRAHLRDARSLPPPTSSQRKLACGRSRSSLVSPVSGARLHSSWRISLCLDVEERFGVFLCGLECIIVAALLMRHADANDLELQSFGELIALRALT